MWQHSVHTANVKTEIFAMKVSPDVHGPQRMNHNDFDEPLTFLAAPQFPPVLILLSTGQFGPHCCLFVAPWWSSVWKSSTVGCTLLIVFPLAGFWKKTLTQTVKEEDELQTQTTSSCVIWSDDDLNQQTHVNPSRRVHSPALNRAVLWHVFI